MLNYFQLLFLFFKMHHLRAQFIPFQMPMLGDLFLSNYVPFKAAEMFVIPSTAQRSPRPSCNKTLGKRSENHARSERERSCQGEEEVWSDPSLLLAEFGGRGRWRVSCLTNALLANVSRTPTELHPSVWLWYCLVVVMCARLHEPSTLSPILGRRVRYSHW